MSRNSGYQSGPFPVSYHPSEREWITAGQFRMLAVEGTAQGGVKLRVEQTGVFSEKEATSPGQTQ